MIDPKGLLFGILGRSPVNFLVRENFSYNRFWNRILSLGRAKWQILSWGKVCVPKIGSAELLFQVKPQILSWGINHNNIGPFPRGGLEKPNPARTIDTLADGS